ncbi:MAG: winged helix-turn-helix transcriptional regulator [Armatimonadetes bacterium]|nr:winged helix-turn-helix transcriptional regulator [Armatimonadota bacterium]
MYFKMRPDSEACMVVEIHEDAVERVGPKMPGTQETERVAEVFKALADPTRARLIFALKEEPLCVCDLAHLLRMSVSAISHQLRVLRNLGLVRGEREGRIVTYSLNDSFIKHMLEDCMAHLTQQGIEPVSSGPAPEAAP